MMASREEAVSGEDRRERRRYSSPNDNSPTNHADHAANALIFPKVIKGEIHNVLSVMRADPRYASPLRFSSELTHDSASAMASDMHHRRPAYDHTHHTRSNSQQRHYLGGHSQHQNGAHYPSLDHSPHPPQHPHAQEHPLLKSLRELTDVLSLLEWTAASTQVGAAGGPLPLSSPLDLHVVQYVAPFCTAIRSREISAPITGAALSALHKFLLYGFISPHSPGAREGMALMAKAIRQCTFEETESSKLNPNNNNNTANNKGRILHSSSASVGSGASSSTAAARNTGSSSSQQQQQQSMNQQQDEQVVLKLLSLSVQVIQCQATATEFLLAPSDMTGIFDTCLHVTHRALNASPLLRSAAGDALGHIVLVVFGRAGIGNHNHNNNNSISPPPPPPQISSSSHKEPSAPEPNHAISKEEEENDTVTAPIERRSMEEALDPTDIVLSIPPGVDELLNERDGLVDHVEHDEDGDESINLDQIAQLEHSYGPEIRPIPTEVRSVSQDEAPALVTIMNRLALLLNPLLHSDNTCVLSLTLINIALETVDARHLTHYPELISIMQNALCKHLLQLSTTSDLVVLSLTLRVIFNLFNSIKEHLKVQLEVFLTSVHLRILDHANTGTTSSVTPEQRELALESLLEFCHEPALMQDLYLNYDCDMQCSNLFETICKMLARTASPDPLLPIPHHHQQQQHHQQHNDYPSSHPSTPTRDTKNAPPQQQQQQQQYPQQHLQMHYQQQPQMEIRLNVLNRLAVEGVLAVIDSIARRCQGRPLAQRNVAMESSDESSSSSASSGNLPGPLSETASISSGVMEPSTDNESDEDTLSSPPSSSNYNSANIVGGGGDSKTMENLQWLHESRERTTKVLHERKKRKHQLALAAVEFSKRPMGNEWVQAAERLGVLPTPATTLSIANFLYSTPKLDKVKIGLYLSKGPKEKYPFYAEVLDCFVSLFDFRGKHFSEALRSFLLKFRLPGEAQCIDRLMEAFAKGLYQQQIIMEAEEEQATPSSQKEQTETFQSQDVLSSHVGTGTRSQHKPNSPPISGSSSNILSPTEKTPQSPFKSADAVFILAFSTIMLNTDLHNPSMKDERRMTLEQFIRNNRGINDGEDLPIDFLTTLYNEIKGNEIQVQRELSDVSIMYHDDVDNQGNSSISRAHNSIIWDGLLSKSNEMATPFFTPADAARSGFFQAGVHERDMFTAISVSAIECISSIFEKTSDDGLVVKALKGFKQMCKICIYFSLDETFNEIVDILLGYGRDYVVSCIGLEYSSGQDDVEEEMAKPKDYDEDEDDDFSSIDGGEEVENPVPHGVLSSNRFDESTSTLGGPHLRNPYHSNDRLVGSAAHRGLLSLDLAFALVRTQTSRLREAWPGVVECLFALRDAKALPPNLSELDDFADSRGIVLRPSIFEKRSRRKLEEYFKSLAPADETNTVGFWKSVSSIIFSKKERNQATTNDPSSADYIESVEDDATDDETATTNMDSKSPFVIALLAISEAAELDRILMRYSESSLAKQTLRALLDSVEPDYDVDAPEFEQHAVFALELAARLLLSNRDRALELYPLFLSKFESITAHLNASSKNGKLRIPYLMERTVVTILRSFIHLYDIPELRPSLKKSLLLLLGLPKKFRSEVADRLACGMAIILRGSFASFEAEDEWVFIGGLLDMAARYKSGRGFVFDGIASCVEYALPSSPYPLIHLSLSSLTGAVSKGDDATEIVQVGISYEGCCVFSRLLTKFIFGSYEADISMSVPAMLCLEKVYWHLFHLATDYTALEENEAGKNESGEEGVVPVPDEELWQTVTTAFYSICLSPDRETSRQGAECVERFLLNTKCKSVSHATWLAVLDTMSSKQPSIELHDSRMKVYAFLGKLILLIVPELSADKENWDALTDIVKKMCVICAENLVAGRRGSVSPLFESTVQTVTNLSNVMMMKEFAQDDGFSLWAGESLLAELEKVGANGGTAAMIAARTKAQQPEKEYDDS